jgi:tRNA threonylcarbamoyladenosine biosynthesis protein TsaE
VLDGPLGAGKTSLTQGIGAQLGVRGAVTSPTFVLAREHRGPLPLLHVDAYRLKDAAEPDLDDLELDLALEQGVVVVEWGVGLVESVAPSRLLVRLGRPDGVDVRRAEVHAFGRRWAVVRPHSITGWTQGEPGVAASAAVRLDAGEPGHSPRQQERCE